MTVFFFFALFPWKSIFNKTGWKGECRYICDELVSSPPYPTIERKECYKSRPRLLPWMQVSGSWFCRWITDKRKDKPANKQTIKLTKQQDDKKIHKPRQTVVMKHEENIKSLSISYTISHSNIMHILNRSPWSPNPLKTNMLINREVMQKKNNNNKNNKS